MRIAIVGHTVSLDCDSPGCSEIALYRFEGIKACKKHKQLVMISVLGYNKIVDLRLTQRSKEYNRVGHIKEAKEKFKKIKRKI